MDQLIQSEGKSPYKYVKKKKKRQLKWRQATDTKPSVKTEDKHLTRSALLVSVGLDWTLCFYYF
jgi:hypothetical protein